MNTEAEPIATPKKGVVNPSGTWVKRDTATGRFVGVKGARKKARKTLLCTVTGVASGNRSEMLDNIRKGLPFTAVVALEKAYGAARKEIASVLAIPTSTMTRRQKEGRLHVDESDRVARLARLKDAALEMMQGDNDAAIAWLHTPLEILGTETPMAHASTEMGARDVEDLIGRIRHGVFS